VNLLVAVVVIAVAAAAFVFSYDGVHAIALFGGVSTRLARYYPGLFDAVLVIACVAAVMLRDGSRWARLWAWVVIIVLLAAIGTTDVLHAMSYALRHRVTEGIVAAAPVVAVLLAFSLLLTLLRQSRARDAEPAGPVPLDVPALPAAVATLPIALPAAPVAYPAPATVPVEALGAPEAVPVPEAGPAPVGEAGPMADFVPWGEAEAEDSPVPDAGPGEPDEAAPPTVSVPALSSEPVPAELPVRVPQSIRYAGNAIPGLTGNPPAAEDDTPPSAEYWDSEEAGPFAGLVYPDPEDRVDLDVVPGDTDDADDAVADDAEADGPARGADAQEPDDEAPPFGTAPAEPLPRLNRVRSMPAPPEDEDEDE
jgi:hypothetical protein